MAQKRTLDSFFVPKSKKHRTDDRETPEEPATYSTHAHYPMRIRDLPPSLAKELASLPARAGKEIRNQPELDLVHFEPFIPGRVAKQMFEFLRAELPFYRVEYKIARGGIQTDIRTPRYTTVFGVDETSRFADREGDGAVVDARTGVPVRGDGHYDRYPPRPIPRCLDGLRESAEAATGCAFNFCLVNYYAAGSDSIAFHSDDERFLGPDPAIASFSLGARRDFVMKHKPPSTAPSAPGKGPEQGSAKGFGSGCGDEQDPGPPAGASKPLKFLLAGGDMILMRGPTQSNWLHSVPKRSDKNLQDGGRINITFRRAVVKGGTENYYNYNVGTGPVYRWDAAGREMRVSVSRNNG